MINIFDDDRLDIARREQKLSPNCNSPWTSDGKLTLNRFINHFSLSFALSLSISLSLSVILYSFMDLIFRPLFNFNCYLA